MSHLTGTIIHLLVTALSVILVAKVLPGIKVKSFGSAFVFAIVVAIFNALAWSVFAVFTIPFTILTLGLGMLIVNGMVFLGAGKVVGGVQIEGCLTAIIGSIGVTILNFGIYKLLPFLH